MNPSHLSPLVLRQVFLRLCLGFFVCSVGMAQSANEIKISFQALPGTGEWQVDKVKFYVSNLKFLKRGEVIGSTQVPYYLYDSKSGNTSIALPQPPSFDAVEFSIGIDSLTNSEGVKGGDLDPMKGMYWTWQSGYINVKIEGKKKQGADFQYHLGGYRAPYNCYRTVRLAVSPTGSIVIWMDVEKFLNKAQTIGSSNIMSPGKEAALLSDLFQTIFSVQ